MKTHPKPTHKKAAMSESKQREIAQVQRLFEYMKEYMLELKQLNKYLMKEAPGERQEAMQELEDSRYTDNEISAEFKWAKVCEEIGFKEERQRWLWWRVGLSGGEEPQYGNDMLKIKDLESLISEAPEYDPDTEFTHEQLKMEEAFDFQNGLFMDEIKNIRKRDQFMREYVDNQ